MRALNAGRVSFAQWQTLVRAALERGGVDWRALLLAAGLVAVAATRRTDRIVLEQLEVAFTDRLDALVDALLDGRLTPERWATAMGAELDRFHLAAAVSGGGRTTAMGRLARARAASERAYLDGFLADVQAGRQSDAQIRARARMYAGALYGTASRGLADALGITLPTYPGMGRCRSRCRCWWEITPVDGGFRCRYIAQDDDGTCPDCAGWAVEYADLFIESEAA